MPRRYKLTASQKVSIALLKKLLACKGYYTFKVARRLKKYSEEFIAINKTKTYLLVWVRPRSDKTIEVKPFCIHGMYPDIAEVIEKVRNVRRCVHWGTKIEAKRKHLELEHFLTPKGLEECTELGLKL